MAGSIAHCKGVRTRYRNILQAEIDTSFQLIKGEKYVERSNTAQTDKCIEKLAMYCEKLDLQSEKLASFVEDDEVVSKFLDEDCILSEKARESLIMLKGYKADMLAKSKDSERDTRRYDTENEGLMKLQSDMQQLMATQLRQQQEVLEREDRREHNVRQSENSVKLPKIDICSFGGEILKWAEFWDTFETTIHLNRKLSDIEKFNYLKSKLHGQAKSAIAGISLSNDNYFIAIETLRERFGDVQQVIDLHYSKLLSIPMTSNRTQNLRNFMDRTERHLRSLEVLGQDINQGVFISMIRSKLPEDVLMQLELQKGATDSWTIDRLRELLKNYVVAREKSETKENVSDSRSNVTTNQYQERRQFNNRNRGDNFEKKNEYHKQPSTAAAFEANPVSSTPMYLNERRNYSNQCRYCKKSHWSDECIMYKTIEERKQKLKDSCFKCLKAGHKSTECRSNKKCVYCGEINMHHRSLCQNKFVTTTTNVHLAEEMVEQREIESGNVFIAAGEMVMMQTDMTKVSNTSKGSSSSVRLLLDSGSQRSYISDSLAESLKLKAEEEEVIKIMTFESEKAKVIKSKVASIDLKLKDDEVMTIKVNIPQGIQERVENKTPITTEMSSLATSHELELDRVSRNKCHESNGNNTDETDVQTELQQSAELTTLCSQEYKSVLTEPGSKVHDESLCKETHEQSSTLNTVCSSTTQQVFTKATVKHWNNNGTQVLTCNNNDETDNWRTILIRGYTLDPGLYGMPTTSCAC